MPTQIVRMDPERQLYLIQQGDYLSSAGFDHVLDTSNHMLQLMIQHDSADVVVGTLLVHATSSLVVVTSEVQHMRDRTGVPPVHEHPLFLPPTLRGTVQAYETSKQVLALWAKHPANAQTFYAPGTPEAVRKLLGRCERNRKLVRLWTGDPATGRDDCEEHDVLGFIGRSMGPQRIPLLVPQGDVGGHAISTNRLLRVMDAETGRDLWRAPNYQPPNLTVIQDETNPEYPASVLRDGEVEARFKLAGEAHAYVAFMHGTIAMPYYLKDA